MDALEQEPRIRRELDAFYVGVIISVVCSSYTIVRNEPLNSTKPTYERPLA